MGSVYKCTDCSRGGILAELREWATGNGDEDGIRVPDKYRIENIIYGPVKNGFVTLQGLYDGSISMHTFFEAIKLSEFELWVRDVQKQKEDQVEYFE